MGDMCTVPVRATYRVIDGEPVLIDAEYAEVPAGLLAGLLRRHYERYRDAAIEQEMKDAFERAKNGGKEADSHVDGLQ